MPLVCGCPHPRIGLHEPFVCRIVPAAMLWFTQRKSENPEFAMPRGIVDAVLTQVLEYTNELERCGFLHPFCAFVLENCDEFFDAVYNDKVPDMHALFCHLSVKLKPA